MDGQPLFWNGWEYQTWKTALPHAMDSIHAGDGWFKRDGLVTRIVDLEGDYLRELLRLLVANDMTRYFKFPELRAEARRRKLRWRFKFLGWYFLC